MNDSRRYSSLRDYLSVIQSRLPIVIVITVLAGAAALFNSLREEEVFQATALLSFEDDSSPLALLGDGSAQEYSPGQTPQARVQTIRNAETARAVQKRLSDPYEIAELQGAISPSLDEGTFLVRLTASWNMNGVAARIANAYARETVAIINRDTRRAFEASAEQAEENLKKLDADDPLDAVERAGLANQLTRLRFLAENSQPAEISQRAAVPGAPISPRPARATAIGLALGLALGVIAAFVADALSQRLRGTRAIARAVPFPVAGHLQASALGKVITADSDDATQAQAAEQVRIIRQNLKFIEPGVEPKVVLVTSALPDEGKSTLAMALAMIGSSFGDTVALVDCDLRRSTLAGMVDLPGAPGVADFLAGEAAVDEIFRHVANSGNGDGPTAGAGSVTLIPAGGGKAKSAELLQSKRFQYLVNSLSSSYDMVVIDTSPVLPIVDTLELLPYVDCVLACVRSGQIKREELDALVDVLKRQADLPTGVIVTGLDSSDSARYGYYEGYEGDRAGSDSAA